MYYLMINQSATNQPKQSATNQPNQLAINQPNQLPTNQSKEFSNHEPSLRACIFRRFVP
jgi:hypothetical protein